MLVPWPTPQQPHTLARALYVTRGVWECPMVPSAVSGITDLAAEEIAEHAAAPQVPDDDEAPAVANEDLAGVPRMFLQSLHHLKHAPLAGLLWQPE